MRAAEPVSPRAGRFRNPILSGFYPDPSICRVGGDFYLVNSSFAYFPGIPIHHSRDLVHWETIGHALDRPSQLDLDGAGHSRGLFAPTIRHHEGLFYLVCTNVDAGGTFLVTAREAAGPWSEPVWLREAPGIDPSLFFDDDGRCWYCGTRPAAEGERYPGNWEVWIRELDLGRMAFSGASRGIWRGALRDCIWPEGPHIYKVDGRYYLLIAEGGTGLDHAVSVARSDSLAGPWIGKSGNPILTHRHLGRGAPIINVGHGDLVDDGVGGWWMALLASRPAGGLFCDLGRETFLVPVVWEDGWPVASPGTGKIEEEYAAPNLPAWEVRGEEPCDHFEDAALGPEWIGLRTPREEFYSLAARPGYLRLRLLPATLRENAAASFVGRRLRHLDWRARVAVEFAPAAADETAGLALIQSDAFQYRLEIAAGAAGAVVRLVVAEGGADRVIAERPWPGGRTVLVAEGRGQDLRFSFGATPRATTVLADGVDGRVLSTERAGGFVGTVIGVFASGGGRASDNHADFDWFEYGPRSPAPSDP